MFFSLLNFWVNDKLIFSLAPSSKMSNLEALAAFQLGTNQFSPKEHYALPLIQDAN